MPNNLPLNWCECKLGDVFHTSSGGTPSRRETAYYGGNIPWLKSGELNDGIISEAEEFITKEGLENSSAKIFPKGSILLALYGATVGKIGILDFDSATNQAVCCIYSNPYFDKNLLFYYLLSQRKHLINQGKGGAQPNISQDIVKNLVLPLPPLAEQERIVAKIEALFASIDEGVERLKSAQAQIKQYRQSVLSAAFSGKLYKTTDWKEVQLKDVCDVRDGTHDSPKYVDNGYPLVTSKNLKNGKITTNNLKYITEADYNKINERSQVEIGDVLFAMIGTIGNPVVIVYPVNYAIKNVALLKKSKIILPFFIKYFLDSTYVQKKMLKDAKGSTQKFVPLGYLRNFKIVLPSLSEQQHIVEEIEKRFAVADELEKAVNEGLEKADKLKQSILKKAFEGKLVPQDPNDEPTSVLLERIKKSQTPTKGKKKC